MEYKRFNLTELIIMKACCLYTCRANYCTRELMHSMDLSLSLNWFYHLHNSVSESLFTCVPVIDGATVGSVWG